jgi:hypothetical protein
VNLAAWFEDHRLKRGIGGYSSSSIVAVEFSEAVMIRPPVTRLDSLHIARYMKEPSSLWHVGGFEFLVYNAVLAWADVDARSAQASFGSPRHVAVVGPYDVMTWAHDLSPRADGSPGCR